MSNAQIIVNNDITLITLNKYPSDVVSISNVFDEIGKCGINIDMISMAPTHGAYTSLSFTISDQDLADILSYIKVLKNNKEIKVSVSSSNNKISVYDERMRHTPGIAAKVFQAVAPTNADVRLITTSEIEIAILVPEADSAAVLDALNGAGL